MAVKYEHEDLLRYLVTCKVDIDVLDRHGKTVRML
jgi:hypothetical protein